MTTCRECHIPRCKRENNNNNMHVVEWMTQQQENHLLCVRIDPQQRAVVRLRDFQAISFSISFTRAVVDCFFRSVGGESCFLFLLKVKPADNTIRICTSKCRTSNIKPGKNNFIGFLYKQVVTNKYCYAIIIN